MEVLRKRINTLKKQILSGKSISSFLAASLFFYFIISVLSAKEITAPTIYFYNPEANINNFALLKKETDSYLSKFGDYSFQPFNDKNIFEDSVSGNKEALFILSSWHYNTLREKYPVKPVLIGVSKGKSTHKKVLSVKKNIKNITSLKGKKIASAGNREYTRNILMQIMGINSGEIADSLKIMPVPKDIDALMAVGFGMAAAALTTEESLGKLRKMNPKHYQRLGQLGRSRELLLSVVAVPRHLNTDDHPLIRILSKMGTESKNKNMLRMIGLDGWRTLTQKELDILGQ